MSKILDDIAHWAENLPYWEQAALDKIMSGTGMGEGDYEELLSYILEDADSSKKGQKRVRPRFSQRTAEVSSSQEVCTLLQLSDLCNVNALVSGQTLTFGPQITVVFGANGSGKSGYAR